MVPKEAATLAAAARSGLSGKPTQKEWRRGKNFSSAFLSVNNMARRGQLRLKIGITIFPSLELDNLVHAMDSEE